MTGIAVDDLVVEYRTGPEAVRPIDGLGFAVERGQLSLLLGASGSGKTTVLSALAGILTPTSGTIRVHDTTVTGLAGGELRDYRRRGGVGIVFQGSTCCRASPPQRMCAAPLWAAGVSRREAARRATSLLAQLDLADRARHRPGELSGGQQQRVAIARFAHDPRCCLRTSRQPTLTTPKPSGVLRILATWRTTAGRSSFRRTTPD